MKKQNHDRKILIDPAHSERLAISLDDRQPPVETVRVDQLRQRLLELIVKSEARRRSQTPAATRSTGVATKRAKAARPAARRATKTPPPRAGTVSCRTPQVAAVGVAGAIVPQLTVFDPDPQSRRDLAADRTPKKRA